GLVKFRRSRSLPIVCALSSLSCQRCFKRLVIFQLSCFKDSIGRIKPSLGNLILSSQQGRVKRKKQMPFCHHLPFTNRYIGYLTSNFRRDVYNDSLNRTRSRN